MDFVHGCRLPPVFAGSSSAWPSSNAVVIWVCYQLKLAFGWFRLKPGSSFALWPWVPIPFSAEELELHSRLFLGKYTSRAIRFGPAFRHAKRSPLMMLPRRH